MFLNLKKSLDFYRQALGLEETRRIEPADGTFISFLSETGKLRTNWN